MNRVLINAPLHTVQERDEFNREIFLPGQTVPPGAYKQIGSGREVFLIREDMLPASLDGNIACYQRIAVPTEYYLG